MVFNKKVSGRTAGYHAAELIAVQHSSRVLFEELSYRHSHGQFPHPGLFHPATYAIELGPAVCALAQTPEPFSAVVYDVRHVRDRLGIVYDCRLAEEAANLGKGRLRARRGALALKGVQKRCFLAADVAACASVDSEIEIVSRTEYIFA